MKFDVKMTTGILYDYMLRHAYTGLSGLLGTAAGVLFILSSFLKKTEMSWWYLTLGSIMILYIPLMLYISAKRQMRSNPAFGETLHYQIADDGITVSQKETEQTVSWDKMTKAVSTGKSIIVYTSDSSAFIFPRTDMGEMAGRVIELVSTHMPAKKVHIKY